VGLLFYRARFYAPSLGRFVSADTIVPDGKNPQAWNRYSYVVNSPLKYIDPSGHCWGIFSFLRDWPLYSQICPTTDLAWKVYTDGDAPFVYRLLATSYLIAFGESQVMLATGTAGLACSTVEACAAAVAAAQGAGADGDPTNEVQAVAGTVQRGLEAVLQLSQRMINKLAQVSTVNPESDDVVLGLWRGGQGYTALAERLKATYLNMPDYLWNAFKNFPGDFWRVNQQFLQNAIDMGKTFILETPFAEAMQNTSSNLYWEIQYLLAHGYQLVNENGVDKLIPK
jgi:hypothetical protein